MMTKVPQCYASAACGSARHTPIKTNLVGKIQLKNRLVARRMYAVVGPPSFFSKSTATKCRTRGVDGVRVLADGRPFRLMAER